MPIALNKPTIAELQAYRDRLREKIDIAKSAPVPVHNNEGELIGYGELVRPVNATPHDDNNSVFDSLFYADTPQTLGSTVPIAKSADEADPNDCLNAAFCPCCLGDRK